MKIAAKVLEGVEDTVIGAPAGSDMEALPAAIAIGQDNMQVMVSRWTPDDHERKLISEGGDVYLMVYGTAHPPVYVAGERPVAYQVPNPKTYVVLPCRQASPPAEPQSE